MTIEIYKSGDVTPIEVWDNYPVVPNVGDRITVYGKILGNRVGTRTFSKNKVKLTVD